MLKKYFQVLDAEPFWSFETQVKVVLACCVVHNHIMGVEPNDHIMEDAMNQVESSDPQQETQSRWESIEDSRLCNAKRDEICQAILYRNCFSTSSPQEILTLFGTERLQSFSIHFVHHLDERQSTEAMIFLARKLYPDLTE